MSREDKLQNMRKMMMTDQQYQALLARSGGPSSISAQLLQSAQGAQYISGKLYADRLAAADPYHPVEGRLPSLVGSALPYTSSNRADNYSDSQDIRAQLTAERGRALLPSSALVDYSPATYVDHAMPRVLAGTSISPEAVGAYPVRYPSPTPQRAAQPLSNAELLAARARRAEIVASHSSGYGNEVQRTGTSSYNESRLLAEQAGSILGPGGARRSRELDQYMLSVQPEKLVRYAASILAPDQGFRRSGYPIVRRNLNSEEDDRYSNYRKAKARQTGLHEFGSSEQLAQRGKEMDIYHEREYNRDRRGGGESGRERRRHSPGQRYSNGSLRKDCDVNRLDHLNSTSPLRKTKKNQQTGGQNKRSRHSETSGKLDVIIEPSKKVENLNSDNDSELGSLCADLSDSDEEKVEKKSDDAATVIDGPLAGMIFGCSSATFHECMRLQLFGLPAKSKDDVMRVTPGTKVFLFNFDTKELSGIFEAISHGGWQLQPDAFRDFGGFPAQVQVYCSEQCPNIPQSVFKPAIKENYVSQTRFRFDLNNKQVKDLVRMFRQAARQQLQDPSADRYLSPHLQSEDYVARGGQQPRAYPQHPQACFGKSRVPCARVISMSPNSNVRKSKRGSKRALKGVKKRKVSNLKPESPMADNCSLYSLSGEIQEADVTINARGCDDASNTNNAVIVGEGIETGNSRHVDQQREIIETPAAKDIAPSGPDHGLSPSKPEEFLQLQSDIGKQVSFLKDSCNDGNVRLAGSRAEEQGQGLGLDVLQGALSSGNLIMSAECTFSSTCEGICSEVQEDLSTTGPAKPLVNLGGNKAQNLAPTTDSDGKLSQLDEKVSKEILGDVSVPAYDKSHGDLTQESIACATGRKLPEVYMDEVLMETVENGSDLKPFPIDKNDGLEVIAADGARGHEALCVSGGVRVVAEVVGKDKELGVRTAEVAIVSEVPFVIEEVIIPLAVAGKDEELDVISDELVIDFEAPHVGEEMLTVAGPIGKDEELKVIAAEVLIDSEIPCVKEEAVTPAGTADEDKKLELDAAKVVIDSETPCLGEKLIITSGALGKDELEGVAAEDMALYYEAPNLKEESMPTLGSVSEKLEKIPAQVAEDFEASFDKEEAMIADQASSNDGEVEVIVAELTIDSEAPHVKEEVVIVAQTPSSELLAFAEEDKVTLLDDFDQGKEVILRREAVDNEQPSPYLNLIHGDDEDEEEVFLAGNVVHGGLITSADEDEGGLLGENQDYEYDEDDEDDNEGDETVDVSVDGELSNLGEDGDEDEDIGEGVDDDASSYDD